ncbi:hypothetical protein DIPPA_31237 [Diplonema papillatum]|nr:hypothetical protein DIPPA_31237 [Diplonema papillatum]
MSRVVLRGASGRMPWAAAKVQSQPAAAPAAPMAAPPAAPAAVGQRAAKDEGPEWTVGTPPPLPPNRSDRGPKRGQGQRAPATAGSTFRAWSDDQCAKFLLGRYRKAVLAGAARDPSSVASDFWEYFLLLAEAKGQVGPKTYSTLVAVLCRIGAIEDAANAVEKMQETHVKMLPDAAGEIVGAYARTGQHSLALQALRFFAAHPEDFVPVEPSVSASGSTAAGGSTPAAARAPAANVVEATFSTLSSAPAANAFARALLEKAPELGFGGSIDRKSYVSVARGSLGGRKAWQVLQRMERSGFGQAQGADVHGALSYACAHQGDAVGSDQVVRMAEKKEQADEACYEGLASAFNTTHDLQGAGRTIDRFTSSGLPIEGGSRVFTTVAQTAAPFALKGDRYATDLCKKLYDTALSSGMEDKDSIRHLLRKVVL